MAERLADVITALSKSGGPGLVMRHGILSNATSNKVSVGAAITITVNDWVRKPVQGGKCVLLISRGSVLGLGLD